APGRHPARHPGDGRRVPAGAAAGVPGRHGRGGGLMSLFRGPRTRLAALQMRIEPGRREENLARAAKLLSTAREREADLACLPATFATGLNFPTLRGDATAEDGPVVEFLAEQARTPGMRIAAS